MMTPLETRLRRADILERLLEDACQGKIEQEEVLGLWERALRERPPYSEFDMGPAVADRSSIGRDGVIEPGQKITVEGSLPTDRPVLIESICLPGAMIVVRDKTGRDVSAAVGAVVPWLLVEPHDGTQFLFTGLPKIRAMMSELRIRAHVLQ